MDTLRKRPGDTYLRPNWWQLQDGPLDGRWGTQAVRYTYMNGQCRYCGSYCQAPAGSVTAHPRAECLACGTPQCDTGSSCIVCMVGFVGRPPWGQHECGYTRCEDQAVARVPRVRRACLEHLRGARALAQLAAGIDEAVRRRERGGQDYQKLAWFGPERRYAVRRVRGAVVRWTTGKDPKGFETAGQADREAQAWNDPRNFDAEHPPWQAERVLLTDEVWREIRADAKVARI